MNHSFFHNGPRNDGKNAYSGTDNHTNISGFRHEGDKFPAWLAGNSFPLNRFHVLCGDRHWRYHSIHPTGFSEFSCGALNRENSRRGKNPGDANSTDPNTGIVRLIPTLIHSSVFWKFRSIAGTMDRTSRFF